MIAEVDDIIQDPYQSDSKLEDYEDDQPKVELIEYPLPEIIDVSKDIRSMLSEV